MRRLSQEDLMRGLNGSPTFLGVIVSTTAVDNSTTASDFEIPAGALLLLVPDADVHVLPGTVADGAVTTANGVPVAADEKFYILLKSSQTAVQAIGAANTKVWRLE